MWPSDTERVRITSNSQGKTAHHQCICIFVPLECIIAQITWVNTKCLCLDSQIKSPLKAWVQLDQLEAGLVAATVHDSAEESETFQKPQNHFSTCNSNIAHFLISQNNKGYRPGHTLVHHWGTDVRVQRQEHANGVASVGPPYEDPAHVREVLWCHGTAQLEPGPAHGSFLLKLECLLQLLPVRGSGVSVKRPKTWSWRSVNGTGILMRTHFLILQQGNDGICDLDATTIIKQTTVLVRTINMNVDWQQKMVALALIFKGPIL